MDWISFELRRGELQNVHGPRPSFTQMIFPQLRQFGAASRIAWRWAMQLHFRRLLSWASEGLVWISSSRMADSRSDNAVDWPCIGVPPAMEILVLGFAAGDAEREFGLDVSEIRRPAADGGSFGVVALEGTFELPPEAGKGSCSASGVADRENALVCDACLRFLKAPAR